ncbi:MAG: ABC transporter ATP-binding protein [Actinomycetota bacterium]
MNTPAAIRAPFPPGSERLIMWTLRNQRRRIALGVTSGILWMGSFAAVPIAVGRAVDGAIDGEGAGRVLTDAAIILTIVAVGALAGAVRHFCASSLSWVTRWMTEIRLSSRVFDRRGGTEQPDGELLSLAINDATAIGTIADLTNRGSGAVVTLIVVTAWLLSTSVSLGLLVLISVPASVILVGPFIARFEARSREERRQLAEATAAAADGITGLRVAQGLGGVGQIRAWFRERSRRMHDAALGIARLEAVLTGTITMLPRLTLVPVLWLGGLQVRDGDITAGTLITVVGLAQFLTTPIFTFGEVAQVLAAGRASARRIGVALDADHAVELEPGVDGAGGVVLAVDDLRVEHLRGVTFAVQRGETLAVACARDRDASELAAALARHRATVGGRIHVAGDDLAAIELDELHHRLAVVDTERPWLLAASLRDNLELARPGVAEDVARAALHTAAADDILARGDALERRIGERGLQLSGGQRQRVAVAQAVLAPADVVVVVEPTSALDAVTESLVVDRFVRTREQATVIITTSPAVLAACERVVFIDDGRVAGTGGHRSLLESDPAYRSLTGGRT